MKFNKIHVFLRQTSHNRTDNSDRPSWFNYEKAFKNLLDTIEWGKVKLTICFDGELKGHFTEKYISKYPFDIKLIDTKNYNGTSYQSDGSSKSAAIISQYAKELNEPEDTLLFFLENDNLFCSNVWASSVLDFFNSVKDSDYYIMNLYHHADLFLFQHEDRTDHWSMYSKLKSKIIATNYNYWRECPSVTSSWILNKRIFDLGYQDAFKIGISDNSGSHLMNEKFGVKCIVPINTYMTHCQNPFLAFFVDWETISNNTILL